MTIIARPFRRAEDAPRRVRLQARDPLFFRAFAQGYALARRDDASQPITEDTMYGYIRRVMSAPELSPSWKAGSITGWFAALYHIPCTFDEQSTPPGYHPALPATHRPRPIEIQYRDPHFPTAYSAGYQAFFAVVGEQPATDEGLYAELARDSTPALGQNLEDARWCAGYIAGFLAALFRVPCFVEERWLAHALASQERRSAP
jgi:hypothetical protein